MTLNENIRKHRISNGLSQVALANALGVTKQCVSNWENDNILPSIEMLTRLADLFSVSCDELLGRSNDSVVSLNGLSPEVQAHVRAIVKSLANN